MNEVKEIDLLCDYRGRDNEPCYGKVDEEEILTEDSHYWIAYCEGHKAVFRGGAYVPKDPIRRIIFSQQNQKIRLLQHENDMLWSMVKLADKKLLAIENNEIEIPAERLEILY